MAACVFQGCTDEAIEGTLYCLKHERIELATEMRSVGGSGGGTSGGSKTDKDAKRPDDSDID
jgi:hypothetical protein